MHSNPDLSSNLMHSLHGRHVGVEHIHILPHELDVLVRLGNDCEAHHEHEQSPPLLASLCNRQSILRAIKTYDPQNRADFDRTWGGDATMHDDDDQTTRQTKVPDGNGEQRTAEVGRKASARSRRTDNPRYPTATAKGRPDEVDRKARVNLYALISSFTACLSIRTRGRSESEVDRKVTDNLDVHAVGRAASAPPTLQEHRKLRVASRRGMSSMVDNMIVHTHADLEWPRLQYSNKRSPGCSCWMTL